MYEIVGHPPYPATCNGYDKKVRHIMYITSSAPEKRGQHGQFRDN